MAGAISRHSQAKDARARGVPGWGRAGASSGPPQPKDARDRGRSRPAGGRAKIVCTIGPATRTRAVLDRLVRAGMDVARLNFSHGTQAEHLEVIRLIRDGESDWGRPITTLQDLQGLRVRLGVFAEGQATLAT